MKPLAFNLKDAKKTAADKNSSTFSLPSGHEIKIIHAQISPLQRKQLEQMPVHKMASGGDAQGMGATAGSSSAPADGTQFDANGMPIPGSGPSAPPISTQGTSIASGADPIPSDISNKNLDLQSVSDAQSKQAEDQATTDAHVLSQIHQHNVLADQMNQKAGKVVVPLIQPPNTGTNAYTKNNTLLPSAALPFSPDSVQSSQASADRQPSSQSPNSGQGLNQIPPLPPVSIDDAYKTGMDAITAQQQAESQEGNDKTALAQRYAAQQVAEAAQWEDERQSKMQEVQNAINDVHAGHINPNHYLESQNTGQHIATAIGLILGGAGAHATGGQNMAMNFLNSQIDRDINAQKSNQQNNQTVLGAYQNKYQNSVAAENMARATNYGIYASQFDAAAAKATDPLARARALQAKAELQSKIIPLVNQANLMQMGSKFNGNGDGVTGNSGTGSEPQYINYLNAAQKINPEVYKDAQSKYVPGVGVSTHPVAQPDVERLGNLNSLEPLVDKAIGDQKNYGDLGAWSPKNRADATSDQTSIQVQLNKLTGLNRLNDQEYKNYGQQVGNIGGVNMGGTLESLKNLKRQIQTDRSTSMANMGIVPFSGSAPPSGFSPQQQKNLQNVTRDNPGVPQATLISALKNAGKW